MTKNKLQRNKSVWSAITAYKFNSIFLRYFLLIFLMIVIPLSAISISIYFYYSASMERELSNAYERSLLKIRDTLDMIFADVDRLSLRLTTDNEVQKFLYLKKQELIDYETLDLLNSVRYKITIPTSEYIHSLFLYAKSSNYVISSTGYYSSLPEFYDSDWYREYADEKKGVRSWVKYRRAKAEAAGEFKNYITLFQLAPFTGPDNAGALIINIDVKEFDQFFGDAAEGDIEDIYIINEKNTVLFNKNVSYIGSTIDKVPYLEGIRPGSGSTNLIGGDGKRKLISYADSEYKRRFKYISVVSLDQDAKVAYVRGILVYFILAGVGLSIMLAFTISIRVYKPFGDIIHLINNPEQLGRSKLSGSRKGLNELKYISSKIVDFNLNRRNMELNLTQYLTMLKKAQSIALQSQINPHFLYNTLGTIHWMAMSLSKGENEVSRMTANLAELMRLSLETQDNLIAIRDEIEHAKKYIEIEKIRFESMFDVIWEIEDEIKAYMVIKITLQPVVENAIYHGIKQKKEKGLIVIRGAAHGERIVLEVEDNGVGMEDEDVALLNSELEKDYIKEDHNIGLKNVNQRIKLIFGEGYGVTLISEKKKGTKVKIEIPKVK